MKDIYCEQCGLYLFSTDKPDGADGAEAVSKGYVYKMPFFFGIEGGHFFCCKEHWNRWRHDHYQDTIQQLRGEIRFLREEYKAATGGPIEDVL